MKLKKIIAGVIALSIIGGTLGINCFKVNDIISISANAEEEVKTLENGMTYSIFRNKERDKAIKILSGDKNAETIEIPEEIDGIKVEIIGSEAFADNTNVKSVVIPKNIVKIEDNAFYGCTSLSDVTFNEGLKELGTSVFSNTAIETITIPSSLEVVADNQYSKGVFENTKLTTANFAEGTKSVIGYLFKDCSLLENINFPKGVETIGEYAFEDCTSLDLKIPDTVESIEESAFQGCTKIKSIEIPDGVKRIEKNIFMGCTNLENVKIPDSVTEIGFCAFADCENLEKLTLPKNVEVLEGCILRNTSVKSINIPASLKVAKNESISSVNYAFEDSYIETAVIDNGMEIIPEGLFFGASKLQTVEIPDTVTTISKSAFSGCESLTDIKIPSGLKSIENNAFDGCENLKKIELNDGLKSLGALAFRHTGITEIVIPKTVESIYGGTGMLGNAGYSAFEDSNVKEVTFAEGATIIPQQSFFGCSTIEKINIPNTVKTIENNAFSGCESLKEIELPEGIETIGALAFSGTGITSLTIPASLKSGYDSAGIIAMGAYSIAEDSNIKEVTFAEGTKKIPDRIFFNCSTLEKVNLPDSVELIGNGAFAGCENLSDIVYNKDSDIKCYQDSFENSGLAEKVPFKILEDSSETIVYGDVNLNGSVTIADAVLLNKYLVDSAALSDQGMTNADAYFDEKITSDDTLAILKLIVGTYDSLPVNP